MATAPHNQLEILLIKWALAMILGVTLSYPPSEITEFTSLFSKVVILSHMAIHFGFVGFMVLMTGKIFILYFWPSNPNQPPTHGSKP